jgi:hypothetical protein
MTTRARKGRILVYTTSLAGKPIDVANLKDGSILVYDEESGKYVHAELSDLETDPIFSAWLATDPLHDFAKADHEHEIGDITLIFDNALI